MNGSVMPFNGSNPTMAPMLINACVLSQANTPVTISRVGRSGARSMMFFSLVKNTSSRPTTIVDPTKPNFSAVMAKIESLAASGR